MTSIEKPREVPFIFTGEMVRAILEGRKTQTRRIVKQPEKFACFIGDGGDDSQWLCDEAIHKFAQEKNAGGKPPFRVWVKETFLLRNQGCSVVYKADLDPIEAAGIGAWKPSIFMPKKYSRVTLDVTVVQCERLWDISEEDAMAEGVAIGPVRPWKGTAASEKPIPNHRQSFSELWKSIHGCESWEANPWVFVYSFKPIKP